MVDDRALQRDHDRGDRQAAADQADEEDRRPAVGVGLGAGARHRCRSSRRRTRCASVCRTRVALRAMSRMSLAVGMLAAALFPAGASAATIPVTNINDSGRRLPPPGDLRRHRERRARRDRPHHDRHDPARDPAAPAVVRHDGVRRRVRRGAALRRSRGQDRPAGRERSDRHPHHERQHHQLHQRRLRAPGRRRRAAWLADRGEHHQRRRGRRGCAAHRRRGGRRLRQRHRRQRLRCRGGRPRGRRRPATRSATRRSTACISPRRRRGRGGQRGERQRRQRDHPVRRRRRRIRGNRVGADAAGATAQPNGFAGINLRGTTGATVGGTAPGDRNVVAGAPGPISARSASSRWTRCAPPAR